MTLEVKEFFLGFYDLRIFRGKDSFVCVVSLSWYSMRFGCLGCVCFDSWDDSSFVSSGISDIIDNFSIDDINISFFISFYVNIFVFFRKNLDV